MALRPHWKGVFTDLQPQDVGPGMHLHAKPRSVSRATGNHTNNPGGPFTRRFMELAVGAGRNEQEARSFLAWALGGLSRAAALLCFELLGLEPRLCGEQAGGPWISREEVRSLTNGDRRLE